MPDAIGRIRWVDGQERPPALRMPSMAAAAIAAAVEQDAHELAPSPALAEAAGDLVGDVPARHRSLPSVMDDGDRSA
jgi:hypothetical protein